MGLYERLTGIDLVDHSTKIHIHQFMSALGELERGKMTAGELATGFSLSAGEQTEAATLAAKVLERPEAYSLGALVTLTNVGANYDTIAASKGLGFVAVDTLGITRLELRVRYNKIGAGTLTWQLWNETDAQEIGTIDDAVAGDNKTGTIIVTPGQPLSGGVKLVRVRAKSTTATDDPVYYGSCLFLRRVSLVTADVLHHVLLLGEDGIAPLNSIANIKSRLGVV